MNNMLHGQFDTSVNDMAACKCGDQAGRQFSKGFLFSYTLKDSEVPQGVIAEDCSMESMEWDQELTREEMHISKEEFQVQKALGSVPIVDWVVTYQGTNIEEYIVTFTRNSLGNMNIILEEKYE